MLSSPDFLHIPYSNDLNEGGIAYALRSLSYSYHRTGGSVCDRLRRIAAEAAVELAFRRYLSEQNIPFEVKSALPFTAHEHYDVVLGNRRCEIHSFLICQRDQISQIKRDPAILLRVPAWVASDQHAGEGHSQHALYLFAFLAGGVTASQADLQSVIAANQPHYLVHVMPDAWNRPSRWSPLGRLVLKSESEETQTIEIGGQHEGREMHSCTVVLPPRRRVEIESGFFSLSYVHAKSNVHARMGIHSPILRQTHLIGASEWGNLWIYGMDVLLVGYITREEFSRRARFIQAGSRIFQHTTTLEKSLAVPISDLRPLSDLFERIKTGHALTSA